MMLKRFIILSIVITTAFSLPPGQLEWVAIGDSITYLNDHPDETGNRVEKGYMTRVTEKLPHIGYINKGYNGWTSGGIADKIEELGIPGADVYTVFLGTNDWWQGRPAGDMDDYTGATGSKTVCGAFRIIVDKLKRLNGRAKIILITPLQRGDFVYVGNYSNHAYGSYRDRNSQSLEAVANAIRDIGKHEGFAVVDLYHKSGINQWNMVKFKRLKDTSTGTYRDYKYPDFINIPFDPANDAYPYPAEAVDMTYDGLHLSDKGNAVIAKMLIKQMKKLAHR
ncbi:MAG: SGNH/GDSL hydrolase family protein [Bacteroidales bacterium]|jgi:lysophospholipase L1-like esterase|nr:SGNH/GDSL hydrolase family protein [Bacteroidales bacterium]